MPRPNTTEDFWKYVRKSEDCWFWTSGIRPNGYGIFSFHGVSKSPHRFSFEINNGPIPRGLCVLHKCDNRSCVRPDHLFLGTHIDNMRDMCAKGRVAFGERQGASKLTEEQVKHIREIVNEHNSPEIAKQYGMSHSTIRRIVTRKSWRHLCPKEEPQKSA